MSLTFFASIAAYFSLLFFIGFIAYRKSKNSEDFVLGRRSVNYWVTAISVQASDMSGWLFMGYPAVVYAAGMQKIWVAVGLVLGMFLTWNLIAQRLRLATERYNSKTLSSYFEARFNDQSGVIRILSAVFCLVFFTFYISSGIVELGILFDYILGIPYKIGIGIGLVIVFYTLFGGFVAMAWIDFFQGLFLLAVLMLVPALCLYKLGGVGAVELAALSRGLSLRVMPENNLRSYLDAFMTLCEWGLGYFGMPHILSKFMGIDDPANVRRAKYIGMSWQVLALTSSVCVGLVGIAFFHQNGGLDNAQYVFIAMVKELFPPFLSGFILCAIVAAAINVIGAQVLVSASVLAEDFYLKFFAKWKAKPATSKDVLIFSRICILLICVLAYLSALSTSDSIFNLVKYAWSGLGCTFGPLLFVSLYSQTMKRSVAVAGILTGGLTGAFWNQVGSSVPAMVAGYGLSFASMALAALVTKGRDGSSAKEG